MREEVSSEDVLSAVMRPNDANARTVRDYLTALLLKIWKEKEGFSGKRPFGNSGWSSDFEDALLDAGMIEGRRDEDGYTEGVDTDELDRLMLSAIKHMCTPFLESLAVYEPEEDNDPKESK